jgi:hypothetical protein
MKVMELARELMASGWPSRKMAILGARYYLGIDDREQLLATLRFNFEAYEFIVNSR